MAFPVVAATSSGHSTSASTSHTLTLPSGTVSGSQVIVMVAERGLASRINAFEITATGSTYNYTSSSTYIAYACYRITGGALVEVEGAVTDTSSTPNAGVMGSSWGSADNLWISVAAWEGDVSLSFYSSGYSSNQVTDRFADATNGVGIAASTQNIATGSEDPGNMTLSSSADWGATCIVIQPLDQKSGYGIGALTLGAVGAGSTTRSGYGVGALTLGAVGVGDTDKAGYGNGALTLGAVGVGSTTKSGYGIGALALGAVGVGDTDKAGYGVAALTLGAVGVGHAPVEACGYGIAALTLGAVGVGTTTRGGYGVGALALGAVGVGGSVSGTRRCCCGQASCFGCCFPHDADYVPLSLYWEVSAPNCIEIDGATGQFNPIGAGVAPRGRCGICECYQNSSTVSLPIQGTAKQVTGETCIDTPCAAHMCFNLYCPESRPLQGEPTLPVCCGRTELLVKIIWDGIIIGGASPSTDDTPCPYLEFTGCSEGGEIRKLLPVACQCFDLDTDTPFEAIYDLSELTLDCSSKYSGGPCDGELSCCDLFDCTLEDATLVISSIPP